MSARRAVPTGRDGDTVRLRIDLAGLVQGVGMRPFLRREAEARRLRGWAANTAGGLRVEVEGEAGAVEAFVAALCEAPPANAVVTVEAVARLAPEGGEGFAIRASDLAGAATAGILPDLATCPACLAELSDPADRRYHYPFIACTDCGPRYTVIEALPYDRERTAMRGFPLCAACAADYADPAGRRFHAEAIACPDCGPAVALWNAAGEPVAGGDTALAAAADAIRAGAIVAVKGLGGFHLLADARSEAAVRRLRERKHREAKPFAVLFPSLAAIAAAALLGKAEAALLQSPQRPIVILRARAESGLAEAVSPDLPTVGALLPYTPLHHLIAADLGFAVVATSGNRSGAPIATDEHEALAALGGIADLFLVHDRPIRRPVDDSVARVVAGRPMLLRRARGFAPAAPPKAKLRPGILALGGHLKAAVALTHAGGVALSQHLGDLDAPETRDLHRRCRDDLVRLHRAPPLLVAHDLHPDYFTTSEAAASGLPAVAVQHHLAHVAAVMAEHGLAPPVLGVAFDGTGYGSDGTVWGGEVLLVEEGGWRRVAHLHPFRLPGGEAAVREPRRSALGILHALLGDAAFDRHDLAPVAAFAAGERPVLRAALAKGVNAPLASSAGRLFDAVAALLGLRQVSAYEGEAAMVLEALADGEDQPAYPVPLRPGAAGEPAILDWRPALAAILDDTAAGVPTGRIAAGFHAGLAEAIATAARHFGARQVALGGGCFQNARLTELAVAALRRAGFTPHWPQNIPANDGGLAFGQAACAGQPWARQLRVGQPSGKGSA